jgi:hypothetical protein
MFDSSSSTRVEEGYDRITYMVDHEWNRLIGIYRTGRRKSRIGRVMRKAMVSELFSLYHVVYHSRKPSCPFADALG